MSAVEEVDAIAKERAREEIKRLLDLSLSGLREICDRLDQNHEDNAADKLAELWGDVTKLSDSSSLAFASLLHATGIEEIRQGRPGHPSHDVLRDVVCALDTAQKINAEIRKISD